MLQAFNFGLWVFTLVSTLLSFPKLDFVNTWREIQSLHQHTFSSTMPPLREHLLAIPALPKLSSPLLDKLPAEIRHADWWWRERDEPLQCKGHWNWYGLRFPARGFTESRYHLLEDLGLLQDPLRYLIQSPASVRAGEWKATITRKIWRRRMRTKRV